MLVVTATLSPPPRKRQSFLRRRLPGRHLAHPLISAVGRRFAPSSDYIELSYRLMLGGGTGRHEKTFGSQLINYAPAITTTITASHLGEPTTTVVIPSGVEQWTETDP